MALRGPWWGRWRKGNGPQGLLGRPLGGLRKEGLFGLLWRYSATAPLSAARSARVHHTRIHPDRPDLRKIGKKIRNEEQTAGDG
jgi:hypothetical protein